MDSARWHRLSTLLDTLLDLDAPARRSRLAQIGAGDAALAADLERMLRREEAEAGFLAAPLVSTAVTVPDTLGPYRLLRPLGEGGMGEVWLAEREAEGAGATAHVALKLFHPGCGMGDPHEREILAQLQHPCIARLLDDGRAPDGRPYLVLEYIAGEPLTAYCRRLDLPVVARLRLFLQVCDAVAHAHACNIVHRDLKPGNVLVDGDGTPHLLDFGIAHRLDVPASAPVAKGDRTFTLHYAAPEQVRGEAATARSDVYSLGVVLYELLAGRKPYYLRRRGDADWEHAILRVVPPRVSQAVLDAARQGLLDAATAQRRARELRVLDRLLFTALHKEPAQRHVSVQAFAADLALQLRRLQLRMPPPAGAARWHGLERRYRAVAGGAAAGAAALASATLL